MHGGSAKAALGGEQTKRGWLPRTPEPGTVVAGFFSFFTRPGCGRRACRLLLRGRGGRNRLARGGTFAAMNVLDPAPDLEARIRRKLARQHFMRLIGADLTAIAPGRVEAELVLGQQHQQQRGFAHGGLVATLADLVAGFAAVTLVPDDFGLVTADLRVSYLHPGVGQRLRAVGWVLKAGRRLHFCEAEVWCDELLIAKASATMAVVEPEA